MLNEEKAFIETKNNVIESNNEELKIQLSESTMKAKNYQYEIKSLQKTNQELLTKIKELENDILNNLDGDVQNDVQKHNSFNLLQSAKNCMITDMNVQ